MSAAQICPEDVLRIIYHNASLGDCARGALVCRTWTESCMVELYRTFAHTITISPLHAWSSLWLRALETSRAARIRVRYLSVNMRLDKYSTPISFLFSPRMEESTTPGCLDVGGPWHEKGARRLIEKSSVIRTVPHLILRHMGDVDKQTYKAFGSNWDAALYNILPAALSLIGFCAELEDKGGFSFMGRRKSRSPVSSSPLQRLSLFLHGHHPSLASLLEAVAGTLLQLHLRFATPGNGLDVQKVFKKAIPNLRNLTELMIDGIHSPILDTLIPHLPKLRYLYCGYHTFTSSLSQCLPTTLEGLCLVGKAPDDATIYLNHKDEFAAYGICADLVGASRARYSHLRRLHWMVVDWKPGGALHRRYILKELEDAATKTRVRFRVVGWSEMDHQRGVDYKGLLELPFSLESSMKHPR